VKELPTIPIENNKEQLDAIEEHPQEPEFLGFHDEFMARIDEFSLSWR